MKAFTSERVQEAISQLGTDWIVIDEKLIQKSYQFDDFVSSLTFVNKVGEIAEAAQHHPDMHIHYNNVVIELSTHDAGGLTQKDVDVATQIDLL